MPEKIKRWFSLLPIRTRITIVTSVIILLAILSGSILLILNVYDALKQEQGYRVLAIARTVAQLETIKSQVGIPDGWKQIQPIAERIRLATDVDYVIIFDMNRLRYSSPIEDRIGTAFKGGDEGPSLGQHEYTSLAKGVQGVAIRAFVPILDSDGFKQVGVVVVGSLLPTTSQLIHDHKYDLLIPLAFGLSVGIFGAWLLTKSIKKQMYNLEPVEIARLLEERESLINSIGEGIIAIDRTKKIRVINKHAARILGVSEEIIGYSIESVIPHSKLPLVLNTDKAEYHQMMVLNNTIVMTNRLPIIVKGKTIGAVATFQDRTEMVHLAEELTGIKKFSDTLRAQNHEYMNKLHTIAGLIQLERHEDALDLIYSYTDSQEELTTFLMKNIKSYSLNGLILGKISHAKELGIELKLDQESFVPFIPKFLNIQDLIIIVGNLIENALDAVSAKQEGEKCVYLKMRYGDDSLNILVKDSGIGMTEETKAKIFKQGFTTKGIKGHGIGLTLIRQYVIAYNGNIRVVSEVGMGTAFTVTIPIKK